MIVRRLRQWQLAQDAADVLVDGALADPQLARDTRIRPSLGHELKDLALAGREIAERIFHPARGDELSDQPGVDDGTAGGNPLERLEKVAYLGDPTLQQVAHPVPFGEQVDRAMDLDVRGEHEDADLGQFRADRPRGIETFGGMRGRHANVEHDDVGALLTHQRHQLRHVPG